MFMDFMSRVSLFGLLYRFGVNFRGGVLLVSVMGVFEVVLGGFVLFLVLEQFISRVNMVSNSICFIGIF